MTPYERLQAICEENGTNVTRFCKELKSSKGNLATWKKGNFSSADLCAIHEKFGVSADYILGLSDEKMPLKKAVPEVRLENDTTLLSNEDLKVLLENNEGVDFIEKLYKELKNKQQRLYVLAWLVAYMASEGLPVKQILGE